MKEERHSQPVGDQFQMPTKEERAQLEARNATLQYDHMRTLILAALKEKTFKLKHSDILALNRKAVQDIEPNAGNYRTKNMIISNSKHSPPPPKEITHLIDDLCDYVNDHEKDDASAALHLSAYVMWRLN